MKRYYWTKSGNYRTWEETGEIHVFGSGRVLPADIKKTIKTIGQIIREFSLPLKVLNGTVDNKEELHNIKKLLKHSIYQRKYIDFDKMEKRLEKLWESGILLFGVIILIDYHIYEFYNPPNTNTPSLYGCGSPEGLVVLREYKKINVIKHEFGHMIGLGSHHDNCVMDYLCVENKFCLNCLQEVKNNWGI